MSAEILLESDRKTDTAASSYVFLEESAKRI